MLPAGGITSRFLDEIGFVDAGGNWAGVRCSACGADAQDWWSDAMDESSATGFENLEVRTGCCGAAILLDEWRYGWPVAFGRYVIGAGDPAAPGLSEAQIGELGEVPGCPVLQVRGHLQAARPRGAQATRSTRHEKQPRFALCRWRNATLSSAMKRSITSRTCAPSHTSAAIIMSSAS